MQEYFFFLLLKIKIILIVYIQSGKDNIYPQYPNNCKTPDKTSGRDQLAQCFSKCTDNLIHNSLLSLAWSEIQIATKIR